MELKDYLAIIKAQKILLVVSWLLIVVLVEVGMALWPLSHEVTLPLSLSRTEINLPAKSQDYDYFYHLEANNLFGKEIVQWFNDPGTINSILEQVGQLSPEDARRISKTIQAEQLAPGFIQVKFSLAEESQALTVAEQIEQTTKEKVALLAPGDNADWFRIVRGEISVEKTELPFWPIIIAAVLIGFWLSFGVVMIKHYWEE